MITTEEINRAVQAIEKERGVTPEEPSETVRAWREYYGVDSSAPTNVGKRLNDNSKNPAKGKLTGIDI